MNKQRNKSSKLKSLLIVPSERSALNHITFVEGIFIAISILLISYVIDLIAEIINTHGTYTTQYLLIIKIIIVGLFGLIFAILYQNHLNKKMEKSSLDFIMKSIMKSSANDWLFDDSKGIYTFKKDSGLTLRREPLEESREFNENWLKKFADSKGWTSLHVIYYNNSPIKTIPMVSVDGDRSTIPYPKITNNQLSIDKFQYKIGEIVNGGFHFRKDVYSFDRYLKKARIKVSV